MHCSILKCSGVDGVQCSSVHKVHGCPVLCSIVQGSAGKLQCSAGQWSSVHYGAVQCGTDQYSVVQCRAVQCSVLHYSAQHSDVKCSSVQYITVQCSKVQCSRAQCHAVQWSTIQCIAPPPLDPYTCRGMRSMRRSFLQICRPSGTQRPLAVPGVWTDTLQPIQCQERCKDSPGSAKDVQTLSSVSAGFSWRLFTVSGSVLPARGQQPAPRPVSSCVGTAGRAVLRNTGGRDLLLCIVLILLLDPILILSHDSRARSHQDTGGR